jgi:hypothetical protein
MRRRDFIAGVSGGLASLPLEALAQQGECVRRIGWLILGEDAGIKINS